VVPAPVEDYTTSRVLTTEYVRGQKVTSLHPVVQLDLDGEVLAEQLFRAYLKQILVDGFVHADPHPGNVFLTEDNRIALLDLGMVARVIPSMQEKLLQVLIAISEGRADEAATAGLKIGRPMADFDGTDMSNLHRHRISPSRSRTRMMANSPRSAPQSTACVVRRIRVQR
jgi:ubiquinone biosynthesis protein